MTKSVQIDKIVDFLKATSTVATIVSDRVFFGEPMREQSWVYIAVSPVSEVRELVNKQALVEIRLVWNDENVRKKQLIDLINIITDEITTTDTNQTFNFNWFVCYKVVEAWGFDLLVSDKNKNILIKDYIFYFLS